MVGSLHKLFTKTLHIRNKPLEFLGSLLFFASFLGQMPFSSDAHFHQIACIHFHTLIFASFNPSNALSAIRSRGNRQTAACTINKPLVRQPRPANLMPFIH